MLHSLSRIISREPSSTDPLLPIRLSAYIDETNRVKRLKVGKIVTLGVQKMGETDFIIGVVKRNGIRPMIDCEDRQIIINVGTEELIVVISDTHVPYGRIPLYTIQAKVIGAPRDENEPAPPPPSVRSRFRVHPH